MWFTIRAFILLYKIPCASQATNSNTLHSKLNFHSFDKIVTTFHRSCSAHFNSLGVCVHEMCTHRLHRGHLHIFYVQNDICWWKHISSHPRLQVFKYQNMQLHTRTHTNKAIEISNKSTSIEQAWWKRAMQQKDVLWISFLPNVNMCIHTPVLFMAIKLTFKLSTHLEMHDKTLGVHACNAATTVCGAMHMCILYARMVSYVKLLFWLLMVDTGTRFPFLCPKMPHFFYPNSTEITNV